MNTPHKHQAQLEQEWTPEDMTYRPGGLAQPEPVLINGLTESETSASMSVMGLSKLEQETDWEGIAADQAMTIALMKSEQEPVAWLKVVNDWSCMPVLAIAYPNEPKAKPVYTSPPKREWVGLTDDDIHMVLGKAYTLQASFFAKDFEAKLKELNT